MINALFHLVLATGEAAGSAAGQAAEAGHAAGGHVGEPSGFENFMEIVSKPDNIPIVALLFIVLYFFWLSMSMARENDRLTMKGERDKIYDRMNRWVYGETDEGEKG